MIFYHGTSKSNWDLIQKEQVLWGITRCWSQGIGWHLGNMYSIEKSYKIFHFNQFN